MNKEKLEKYIDILDKVADKLIGSQLHSGNVAHDAPTKGYTIKNCLKHIQDAIKEDSETVSFYCVETEQGTTFLVNTDTKEDAIKIVEEERGCEVLCVTEFDIMKDECRDLENMFL